MTTKEELKPNIGDMVTAIHGRRSVKIVGKEISIPYPLSSKKTDLKVRVIKVDSMGHFDDTIGDAHWTEGRIIASTNPKEIGKKKRYGEEFDNFYDENNPDDRVNKILKKRKEKIVYHRDSSGDITEIQIEKLPK